MSEEWEFYFSRVNDVQSSIFVNLGLRGSAPMPTKPHLLWIWIYFNHPREDGLSSSEESPVLNEIEDALTKQLAAHCGGLQAGRITGSGRREFYFYGVGAQDFDVAVSSAMTAFQEYRYDSGHQDDREWAQYLNVLYPSATNLQQILNRRVVDQMKKNGDVPDALRTISHWAYFKTGVARDTYVSKLSDLGFSIEEQWLDSKQKSAAPFAVRFSKIGSANWNALNTTTIPLWRMADDLGGDYDGWEAEIVRAR